MQYRPHRYNTTYPADIATALGPQKGVVLDVHNEGAQVQGLRGMHKGDKLKIQILSTRVQAIVQWAAGERVGIVFRPRISDDQVDTLRYRRDGRKSAHRGTVGFGFAEMR